MLRSWSVSLGAACAVVLSCGGSSPPASSPASAKSTPAAAVEKHGTTGEVPPAAAPAASTAASDSTGEKPTRPPHEILQLKDTIFKFNFDESERGRIASETCDQKAASDPRKRSACMSAARDALDVPDGYQLQRVGDDWMWKAVRLRGARLTTLSKTPIEFGAETDDSIVVKFLGKPSKNLPPELKVAVPSDYRIVLTDARYGDLVYEAKVGIASGGD
jgi:hypothetical protein